MLKRSERNSIIEDFRNGIINPEYEVKATKTKGRYTVRKRKVPLTDEQMNELDGGEEQEDQTLQQHQLRPTKNTTITQQLPPVKRSKKENALFELQNQLNSQMLTQITELTNKVAKLKAWKKAVKKEMYEEVEDSPEMKQQVEPSAEPEVQPQVEPEVEPSVDPDYMSQIPEQYIQLTSSELRQYEEPQQYVQSEQTFEEPAYYPSSRNSIDYSKFGF